ncbi:hypothetical protein LPUS_08070 [Lasallia pustulata]|uniref:Uncharacterized protein n=1 Tax=Lasallia pustulata TaxID=136370 RepID=A0A1W5D4K6_9LECA|nr:hypothetical protein LPUS_08070 [Lasallia pustulata]
MTEHAAWKGGNGKGMENEFRCVYLGGAFTVTDQTMKLWWMEKARKVRGRAQTMVMDWEGYERARGRWKSVVVRPAGVGSPLWKQNVVLKGLRWMLGDGLVVGVDELAEVMIEAVMPLDGGGGEKVVESKEIASRGRSLLARKAGGMGSER